MNVLIDARVLSKGNISGIEEYTRFMIQNLLDSDTKNHYEFFYSGIRRHPFPEEWRRDNTSLIEVNLPNKALEVSMRLFGVPHAETKETEVIFSPHFNYLPASRKAKRIITFHDLSFIHFPELYPLRKRFWHWQQRYQKQAECADALIAVSEFTRQDIIKTFRIPESKVHTIHSGINPFYTKLNRGDASIQRLLERDRRLAKPFLLFVGTIEPRKNISGIIKAFDAIKNDPFHRELRLIIAGKRGWLCDTIFKDAARAKWSSDIVFWGEASHEELRVLYNLSEGFVYPSFFEGFGFPPLEAQACGAPVITSNRSSLPEIMGTSALLVDPWKVSEIGNAMNMVLKNTTVRNELVARGADNVRRFTWKKASTALVEIINSLEPHATARTEKKY